MQLNPLTVAYADIPKLLAQIESCGVALPKQLADIPLARERLVSATTPPPDPLRGLVAAALDGKTSPDKVDKALEAAAIGRLVQQERNGLEQRVEPALLKAFGERLEQGAADQVISVLRPQFDGAADFLSSALDTLGGFPHDPAEFLNSASAEQLAAYQGLGNATVLLDRVGAIVSSFGPLGSFPVVADPRHTDPNLRAGWLHSTAVMCTDNDLLRACSAFQAPHPYGDVATSPWLRCRPILHSISSATERLRSWCEHEWAVQEAERPQGGRMIGDVIVPDEPRPNPFALGAKQR
jgi:hypothetical protein